MSNIEKLQALINEADTLMRQRVLSTAPDFVKWHTKTERFLKKQYGIDSDEVKEFSFQQFTSRVFVSGIDNTGRNLDECVKGLQTVKAKFEVYLDEMKETEQNKYPAAPESDGASSDYKKVFIVHGHDTELKQTVARLVEKQGLEAIILSEQTNRGKTIIEKFEQNSDVNGAICLFTADDAMPSEGTAPSKKRARQNVVFETGYFMGKLGRNYVILLADNDVELPSDLQGIVYANKHNWTIDILRELKDIGYPIDLNKMV